MYVGERIVVRRGNEGPGLILDPTIQAGQKLGWDPGRSWEMVIASHGEYRKPPTDVGLSCVGAGTGDNS